MRTNFQSLLVLILLSWPVGRPVAAQFDVVGPIQADIVGDTLADEGDRVAYSVVPWTHDIGALFQWDFGDGSPIVSRAAETALGHRFMEDGEYHVGATNGGGVTTLRVTIRPVPPRITVLSASEPSGPAPSVQFQAAAHDPGRDTLTYAWDFGDGSPVQSGVDLVEPRHTYEGGGAYQVTLVVTDEDGLESVRTIRVDVNPGFLGQLSGDVTTAVEGVSGKASLMNPMPGSSALPIGNMPIFTGSVPMGLGVVDLSDAMGICLVYAGFWDDGNKVHVNFQWTADAERMFVPNTYQVQWRKPQTEGQLPADQVMVNALVLEIEPSYEDTKRGAENMQLYEGGGGLLSGISRMLSALSGAGGQPPPPGPGTNWQLASLTQSGELRITRVTRERIDGRLDVELIGSSMNPAEGQIGSTEFVRLEGSFAWELDEVSQVNLERCAERPFAIEAHTPDVEEEAVDYEVPRVSVTFNLPIERETVTADVLELGYLDPSDQFHRIATRIVFDGDPRKVWLVPDDPLDDAVYHKVKVRGGDSGVRSLMDSELDEDYEWRFSTFPELVKRPEAGQ